MPVAGAGQSLGTSQAPDTPPHQASPYPLPTADTTENLTLGGQEGWHGGNGTDWEAAMSLLICFLKELTPLK